MIPESGGRQHDYGGDVDPNRVGGLLPSAGCEKLEARCGSTASAIPALGI